MRAVGLEHDLAARSQHVRERPQQPDRVGHPMQDTETQHDVEALAQLAHVERVHAAVLDPGSDQPRDRAEAGAALKRHAEASTHPVDILLIVDRDNAPRTADLREEAVEAVKRAHVKHAKPRETIRAEHRQAIAVIAGDTWRVNPRRKRERVKPQRNGITDTLGVQSRRSDRIDIGDNPL